MKKINLPPKKCLYCKKEFRKKDFNRISDFRVQKFCSRKCYYKWNTGKHHWYWRGGIKRRPDGYLRDSKTDKFIHRIVMEKHLGRLLQIQEQVHHIDGNPANNKIGNLRLYKTNSAHRKYETKFAPRNKNGQFKRKKTRNVNK